MMAAIIRITAPSPTTRIKLGCLIFFEGATAEGLDGRFGGATDGAVSELGAVYIKNGYFTFNLTLDGASLINNLGSITIKLSETVHMCNIDTA